MKFNHGKYQPHHRKPKKLGGTNHKKNISMVNSFLHRAWSVLFGNLTAQEIAREINKTWLDPEFKFIVKRR